MPTSNYTTHCIYRIVCFATGKVYVGRTNNSISRESHHFSELNRGIHFNSHLQNAFNKYGRRSFYFEVLEKDIATELICEREAFWISYFDCFHNGFNQTAGGEQDPPSQAVSCTWNGVKHPSIKACALANNVHQNTMRRRLSRGFTCDDDMINNSETRCTWNGIEYKSVTSAAEANGVSKAVMQKRLSNGYAVDADVGTYNEPCEWNGVLYENRRDCATAIGAKIKILWEWLRNGYKCDDDIPVQIKPCVWNGVTYASRRQCAIALGITPTTVRYRIDKGYTCDDDLGVNNALVIRTRGRL